MKKQVYLNTFFTITIALFGFITNRVFSDYLGTEALGLMRLFSQLVVYLNLAELGLATASTYALYKPIEEKDTKKINIIVSTFESFYKNVGLFVCIVGLSLTYFVGLLAGETEFGYFIYIFWVGYVINTAISFSYAKYTILLVAHQNFTINRSISGITYLLFSGVRLLALIYFQSFSLFIALLIIQNITLYGVYRYVSIRRFYYIQRTKERDYKIIADVKKLFWHKVAGLIVMNTDYILLAIFTSLSVIAVYSSHLLVYSIVTTIVGIGFPVISPRVGKYIASNSSTSIFEKWKELHIFFYMIGVVVSICTFYLINPFVKLWMGEGYELTDVSVALLMLNLFIHIVRSITDIFKVNSGYFKDIHVPILEASINLVLSLLFVQFMGLNGVILGTVISNFVIIYMLKPILVFNNCFNKKSKDYIVLCIQHTFLAILVVILSSILIGEFNFDNVDSSWFSWGISSVLILLITLISAISIFSLDSTFRKLILNPSKMSL